MSSQLSSGSIAVPAVHDGSIAVEGTPITTGRLSCVTECGSDVDADFPAMALPLVAATMAMPRRMLSTCGLRDMDGAPGTVRGDGRNVGRHDFPAVPCGEGVCS